MANGFAIGPQTPLAHEVAAKFLALTGHDASSSEQTESTLEEALR